MQPFTANQLRYANYLDEDDVRSNPARAAFGPNYDRLLAVKNAYDPDNLFHMNTNMAPAVHQTGTGGVLAIERTAVLAAVLQSVDAVDARAGQPERHPHPARVATCRCKQRSCLGRSAPLGAARCAVDGQGRIECRRERDDAPTR